MVDVIRKESSSSVRIEDGIESTPKNRIISFEKYNRKINNSSEKNESYTSTPIELESIESRVSAFLSYESMEELEAEYNQKLGYVQKKLIILLKNFTIEADSFSPSEEFICNIVEEYSFGFLGNVLTGLYIDYYDDPVVLSGICSALERFDESEVFPWGQSIVIGLINHKSELVKERVICLIENWADYRLLPALKNMDISTDWMRQYANGVIAFLEDKDVLRAKSK